MTGKICKARKHIIDTNTSVADRITDRISNLKKNISKVGKDSISDLKNMKNSASTDFDEKKQRLKGMYMKQPWRQKRPDVTLLVELVFVIVLAVILYYAWPYFTGNVKPGFSKEQFVKATKMPETAFNLEDVAKVNLEVKSLQDYAQYFKNNPYSLANNGIYDLMVSVAILPLIIFFIQFVLPPFVIAYVIWFILRFWPYVIAALWGWFISMYNYFTRLIQGKLGCKWYIRMVTGWGCNSPNFYTYFITWRRRYIDMPIYYEKLKYIQKYYWAKRNYYEIPYHNYITVPYQRYKIKTQFAKKVYVDRAVEVFLKKLRDVYPQYYTMPRDEFYGWLLGNNRHLAGVYAKAMQAKAQIEGGPYRSMTEQGNQCTCPGTKTPYKMLKKSMKKQGKEAKDDLGSLINATNKVYDTVTSMNAAVTPSCDKVDKVIDNRKNIAGTLLIAAIVASIVLYMFSAYYGTPSWLKNIITPTAQYVTRGVTLVASGQSRWSLPIVYVAALSSALIAVMFT